MITGSLEHIWQACLGIIKKLFHKLDVKFSVNVLSVIHVILAFKLKSSQLFKMAPCRRFEGETFLQSEFFTVYNVFHTKVTSWPAHIEVITSKENGIGDDKLETGLGI